MFTDLARARAVPAAFAAQAEPMHVVAATVVHHPQDARILYRQIAALVAHGHTVTYIAPWTATGALPPPTIVAVDVPRALGRRRLAALRAARRRIAAAASDADVLLLHDPELVVACAGIVGPTRIWDVHEDTGASLSDKPWLPAPVRP